MVAKLESVDLKTLSDEMRKAFEEAKSRLGEDGVFVLETDQTEIRVVCRRPDRPAYRKFRTERNDPGRRAEAFENLFLACLIFPTAKDFAPVLDKAPALADTFGTALWADVLGTEDATVKKA